MKTIKLVIAVFISLLLIPVGNWINTNIMTGLPPVFLINFACLVIWGNIAFFVKDKTISTKATLVCMHIIPAGMLAITAYLEKVAKSFLIMPWGHIVQVFYAPVMWLKLPAFGTSLVSIFLSCFLTMLGVAFMACKAKETVLIAKGE
ncbi:MAG: hypothetical protein E7492_03625 [Ruminococcaceae bacterium]|nr:hypothetical protein [Oscillospiraceae bacterium]